MDKGCGPLDAGVFLADIMGNGRLDFVGAHDASDNGVFWWALPDDPTRRWTRREIFRMPDNTSHHRLVADLDGDERPEVYFWNQCSSNLFWAPLPQAPRVSPDRRCARWQPMW